VLLFCFPFASSSIGSYNVMAFVRGIAVKKLDIKRRIEKGERR
jgi:hypothetical protein